MQLKTFQIGEVLAVEILSPWLDGPRGEAIAATLLPCIAGKSDVLIDLSRVRYLDLFAFDALLASVQKSEGAIAFCGANPATASLFAISLPRGCFPLFDNVEAALSGMANSKQTTTTAAMGEGI